MFDISCYRRSRDFHMFQDIVSQGLDSRLEAFTKSTFTLTENRLYLQFHDSEMQILIRRLLELENDHADEWAEDIVQAYYGEGV